MTDAPPRIALLLIGNELLSGKVIDTNGPFAIRALRDVGAVVGELRVVSDDEATIAAHVRALAGAFDVVVTSGGVGPTHDDVTMAAVAEAFGDVLETRDELMTMIRRVFAGDETNVRVWSRMAQVPSRCELVLDEGMRWPVHRVENVWVLPGVPQAFERQLRALLPRFAHSANVVLQTLYLSLGEGHIAEALTEAVSRHPEVAFGSYPVYADGGFRTRITLEARDSSAVATASNWLRARIGERHILEVRDGDGELGTSDA